MAWPRITAGAALALSYLAAAACGGSGGGNNPEVDASQPDARQPDAVVDAMPDAPPDAPPPMGDNIQYVMSALDVPESANDAAALGFDLDGNGSVDNQLGRMLATFASATGTDVQLAADQQLARAGFVQLLNVQAEDLANADPAGVKTFIGDISQVMACADPNDTVCGLHLDGQTSFTIDASSPQNALIVGTIANGRFAEAAPGTASLQVPLDATTPPVALDLAGARLEIEVVAQGSLMSGKLGGAISEAELQTDVLPAITNSLNGVIANDCPAPMPGACCPAGTTGETLLALFDTDMDCALSLAEIENNGLISSLLAPDVDLDGDGAAESISIGVGFEAVGAVFEPILP